VTEKAKPYCISKWGLFRAYGKVRANKGSAGVDGIGLDEYGARYKDNLYKLWNRMSSGSYMPKPVRLVEIPKPNGGKRPLGIPTVEDRIAQMLVVDLITPTLEDVFHEDSYGYRPHRSAHDAIGKVKERCWRYDWVLDLDISKFFDTIDHELLMKAVRFHISEKWILLYVERWLKVPYISPEGETVERTMGVPQGSVIGPVLANLFLHYCFDNWMRRRHPEIPFARYADDSVCHCRSLQEALRLKAELVSRFSDCKLRLNEEKTKVVYCKSSKRKGDYPVIAFDFLGHTFKPCKTKNGRDGSVYMGYLPVVSQKAKKKMKDTMRSWNLKAKGHTTLKMVAEEVNPIIRGWMNYYGRHARGSIRKVMEDFNLMLARWVKAKYKYFRRKPLYAAYKWLGAVAKRDPLFYHWRIGVVPPAGCRG